MGLGPLEDKLYRELISPVELSEPQVVYMLVCVRKLLEIKPAKLPSLKFHCDWALHSQLDRIEAVKVIKLFDELEQALHGGDLGKAERLRRNLHRIVNHEQFRREFGYFLRDHHLPTDLSDLSAKWIPFWSVYMDIIHDVPLEFTSTPIRNIRKVTVKRVNESRLPGQNSANFAFGVNWILERYDGQPPADHGLDYEIFNAPAIAAENAAAEEPEH